MNIEQQLKHARQLSQAGKLQKAELAYRKILKIRPHHLGASIGLAKLARRAGNPELAERLMSRAAERDPNNSALHEQLGDACYDQKKFLDAAAAYRRAIETGTNTIEVRCKAGDALVHARRFDEAEAAFDAALAMEPTAMFAWVGKGDVRRNQSDEAGALRCYATASAHHPDEGLALRRMRSVFDASASPWHFPMMNDPPRNDAYDAAIRAQIGDGQTVLDIGAGSGLLSMMAARAGAARVYACDDSKTLASAVTFIANQNGLGDRVQAIAKRSTDLEIGVDLPDRADALVCEIFDVSVFGEDALYTVRHAREHLLKPGATVIPNGVRVWAAPVRSDALRQRFQVGTVGGFDLSAMNALADKRTFQLDLRRIPYTTLAEPFVALEVDFNGDIELILSQPNDVPVTAGGDVDGFVFWYELVLGGSHVLSTAPTDASTHWLQGFLPQWTPLSVSEGDTLRVTTQVRRQVIWFEPEVAPAASTAPPSPSGAGGEPS